MRGHEDDEMDDNKKRDVKHEKQQRSSRCISVHIFYDLMYEIKITLFETTSCVQIATNTTKQ